MLNHTTEPKYHIRLWVLILAISALSIAAAVWWQQQQTLEVIERAQETIRQQTPPVRVVRAEANLAFVGDIFLGRGVDRAARNTDNHASYPFAKLDSFKLNQYQSVIGNLECPAVNDQVNYQQQFEELLFNCPISYLPELAKHFDVVSLANNHTANQGGQTGLEITRQNLETAGLNHFGNYEPAVLDDICKLVPIEVKLLMSDGSYEIAEVAVQLCGYHTVFRRASAQEIATIIPGSGLPTFVMPHAGAEYRSEPIPGKIAEFRSMIDAGADMVVGAHPHWVQTTEVYDGKLIAYSLGNFIFDQWPGETSLGALLSARLTISDSKYLAQLRNIAKQCELLSECPELAQLEKPFLDLSYKVQAVDIVDYRPQAGSAESQQKVENRFNLPPELSM